jgi:hypothetical protein
MTEKPCPGDWELLLPRLERHAARQLRQMVDSAELPRFYDLARESLESTSGEARYLDLRRMLLRHDVLAMAILTPGVLSREEAVDLARLAIKREPCFDARLLSVALSLGEGTFHGVDPQAHLACLAVLEGISTCERLVMPLIKFMRSPDERVRSKAALLIGRANRSPSWMRNTLRDEDDRTRANLVEGIAAQGRAVPFVESLLEQATADRHQRVVANALLGLCRLGREDAVARLEEMTRHPNPRFRKSAEWALGEWRKQAPVEPEPEAAGTGETVSPEETGSAEEATGADGPEEPPTTPVEA